MVMVPEPEVLPLRGGPVLRWGVIGPGEIANDFTRTLHANSDQRVVAVGSRSLDRAQAFAREHGVPTAHGSYEALVADPDVDVVYVASPHPQHLEHALLAIAAGKHVLVEKPMTTSAEDTELLAERARAAGVFVMEALWTRYLPHSTVIARMIADGHLGDVQLALVDVGWPRPVDPADRMFDPAQSGGPLLDAGVYGLWLAQFAIGPAAHVTASGTVAADDPAVATRLGPAQLVGGGVDLQSVATLRPATGTAVATVSTTMLARSGGLATIAGTDATVRFTDHFVFPASFVVIDDDGVHPWQEPTGLRGREGLVHQAVALASYVTAGRTDSPLHSLDDSIALARTMDAVRAQVADGSAAHRM
jgi:predicted dehydrogenase